MSSLTCRDGKNVPQPLEVLSAGLWRTNLFMQRFIRIRWAISWTSFLWSWAASSSQTRIIFFWCCSDKKKKKIISQSLVNHNSSLIRFIWSFVFGDIRSQKHVLVHLNYFIIFLSVIFSFSRFGSDYGCKFPTFPITVSWSTLLAVRHLYGRYKIIITFLLSSTINTFWSAARRITPFG